LFWFAAQVVTQNITIIDLSLAFKGKSMVLLKQKVIEKLNDLNESALTEVLNLIEFQQDTQPYQLSEAEKAAIQEGIDDIEAGNYYSNEDVEKEMLKCLKR